MGELDLIKMVASAKKWIKQAKGTFNCTEFARDNNIHDSQFRDSVLREMCHAKLIERDDSRNGWYHRIDDDCPSIDFWDSEIDEYPLWLPLDLMDEAIVSPGNIIILAGETNSGKTAYALKTAYKNLKVNGGAHDKVRYLNSEMHPAEFKGRALSVDSNRANWQGLDLRNRSRDFHSVIDPNGLNIIDFLENLDNFWKVGGEISKIHNTLQEGVAIILLQKKQGERLARGGDFTLEKSRLAMSLFWDGFENYCSITKCKAYRGTRNPQGMERDFTIQNGGSDILSLTPWEYMSKEDREMRTKQREDQSKMNLAQQMNSNGGFDY